MKSERQRQKHKYIVLLLITNTSVQHGDRERDISLLVTFRETTRKKGGRSQRDRDIYILFFYLLQTLQFIMETGRET